MNDHTIYHVMEAWEKGMWNFFEGDRQWEVARGFDLGGDGHRNWQSICWKVWKMLAVETEDSHAIGLE